MLAGICANTTSLFILNAQEEGFYVCLRDFIMEHHWIVESFEASMAWPVVLVCYQRVKDRIKSDCSRLGIKYPPLVMVRLTQVYDGGAVLYFYFGFNWAGLREPIKVSGCILSN